MSVSRRNTSKLARVLRVSLYPRTTTSQAFLDNGWYTLSTQQGKRTIHNSGNWLPTAGNGTTQQVIAIVDVENKHLLSNGVLRERHRAAKKNLTTVLYDLTNAFACGAQESQAGDPASLADVVRAEVQNLTARENLCHRLAGAQLRLDCADSQLAAKIGSDTLPGDTVAHPSSKLTRLCLLTYQTLLSLSMWAHQHMRTTSLEKFPGSLQKMSSQESIAPTMLSTLLWHQIMFKTVADKRFFLTSLVAGHTPGTTHCF